MNRALKSTLALASAFCLLAGPVAGAASAEGKKLAPIKPAPEFALKRSDNGKTVKLSDFKGKIVLVDFWATWCPPCREEIPGFVDLQKKYNAKGLEIVGLSVDRNGPGVVNAFSKENGINYTSLMSESATETAYGGIRSIPTTFLIDRQGNIVKKYIGGRPVEEFEADIKSLL